MQLNHKTAFATYTPAPKVQPGFVSGTLVETPSGWMQVQDLKPGDLVATLDGGFRAITRINSREDVTSVWRIPGGALGTCSDLLLTQDQHLALNDPACRRLFGIPTVLAPVSALAGHQGIHQQTVTQTGVFALHFNEEEVIWAHTGARVHVGAADQSSSHYRKLNYGETRALLLLSSNGCHAPDIAA